MAENNQFNGMPRQLTKSQCLSKVLVRNQSCSQGEQSQVRWARQHPKTPKRLLSNQQGFFLVLRLLGGSKMVSWTGWSRKGTRVMRRRATKEEDHKTKQGETKDNWQELSRIKQDFDNRRKGFQAFILPSQRKFQNRDQDSKTLNLHNFLMFIIFSINIVEKKLFCQNRNSTLKPIVPVDLKRL